jgi:hypothetical protein
MARIKQGLAFDIPPGCPCAGVYDISEQVKAVKTRAAFERLHLGVPDEDVATIVNPEEIVPEIPADQGASAQHRVPC